MHPGIRETWSTIKDSLNAVLVKLRLEAGRLFLYLSQGGDNLLTPEDCHCEPMWYPAVS